MTQPSVAVVGGGLAGLSAAAALCELGFRVELFEGRRSLGGRAGSFDVGETGSEPSESSETQANDFSRSGEAIDHCQHVGMGCCTNLADFCRRLGIERYFRRDRTLFFFGPNGRRYDFRGSNWLPAPLHLAPALAGLGYLSWTDRLSIARAMIAMARTPPSPAAELQTIGQWLAQRRQSKAALDRFWSVVLVSALGETLDRASFLAARKVFVDGFLSHRDAYAIDVPTAALGEIYGERVSDWLRRHGAVIHLGAAVTALVATPAANLQSAKSIEAIDVAGSGRRSFDYYIVAVPWRRLPALFDLTFSEPASRSAWPLLDAIGQIEAAPIIGAHLWFDSPITFLPHAVLIDRLSQWAFRRGADEKYVQVVISASRELVGRSREAILDEIVSDLRAVFPAAKDARLVRAKLITQKEAVFSVRPGLDAIRPGATSPWWNLALAGDWTATGWPATMEGAVRSGRLAAQAIDLALRRRNDPQAKPANLLAPDLPRGWLARRIIRV
jgi:squalene-associated FAD-dependent desaturase